MSEDLSFLDCVGVRSDNGYFSPLGEQAGLREGGREGGKGKTPRNIRSIFILALSLPPSLHPSLPAQST